MKIASLDGQLCEAQPSLSGVCPHCNSRVVAKCGERRIWHWAHLGNRNCDRWWEPETEWHRGWKNYFPREWQERAHFADNGEKHVADIKTAHGCVIEFQHSYLKPEERRAREAFYKPVVWVVDGLRLKRGKSSFYKALSLWQNHRDLTVSMPSSECSLLRDWADSGVDVYLDFGSAQEDIERFRIPVLWHFGLDSRNFEAILAPVSRENFVSAYIKGDAVKDLRGQPVTRIAHVPTTVGSLQVFQPLHSFQLYLARKRRRRARF